MHMTREGGRLACRLLSLPHSGMGRCALEYASLVSDVPDVGLVPIPPHWDSRLGIYTRIPGIRAKRNTPQCALLQEASACRADETIAHIRLQCPGYADHRRQLFAANGRLGLPHVSREDLLLPCAHRTTLLQACYALLDFFGDADLFTRL
ncbi:hypothetical protein HPB52_001822 [Rhipicephalus sanguineus]|uniref:Tick transposon n=1 Tax=Rhipicephalus sanguineus TaxID=34632 RepID=A0A9D4PEF1_RHISA|nr:hypothetical protein HPB52_001822 [Rhipicephalus sanguineus]